MVNQHPISSDLQDVLSARQYLSGNHDDSVDPESLPGDRVSPVDGQERINISSDQSVEAETVGKATPPENGRNRSSRLHVRRSSGRPRLDASSGAVLSEDRRAQIRRAQRTYRLKKEADLERVSARIADLERKLNSVAAALADYKLGFPSEVQASHPALFKHLDCISDLLESTPGAPERSKTSRSSSLDSDSGKHTSSLNTVIPQEKPSLTTTKLDCDCLESNRSEKHTELPGCRQYERERRSSVNGAQGAVPIKHPMPTQDIAQLHRKNAPYTYCFQEVDFSRKLQRYCLEYAFRLFVDPRSEPLEVYRVFRLVPCMQDKTKMLPYFQRLVTGGINDPLEIRSLPFYCIGGAGTHYPRKDEAGNPIYPARMRLPRRILGVFQMPGEAGKTANGHEYLDLYGYGGQWFDCRDVEGYLGEQGVDLDGSSLLPYVHSPHITQPLGYDGLGKFDQQSFGNDTHMYSEDAEGTHAPVAPHGSYRTVLDVQHFFNRLLSGVVILGRMPGFRQADVVAAFNSALRIQNQ